MSDPLRTSAWLGLSVVAGVVVVRHGIRDAKAGMMDQNGWWIFMAAMVGAMWFGWHTYKHRVTGCDTRHHFSGLLVAPLAAVMFVGCWVSYPTGILRTMIGYVEGEDGKPPRRRDPRW